MGDRQERGRKQIGLLEEAGLIACWSQTSWIMLRITVVHCGRTVTVRAV